VSRDACNQLAAKTHDYSMGRSSVAELAQDWLGIRVVAPASRQSEINLNKMTERDCLVEVRQRFCHGAAARPNPTPPSRGLTNGF